MVLAGSMIYEDESDMGGTVLFLGAGATKSVQGPMTDEILPAMFAEQSRIAASDPKGPVAQLVRFLENASVAQGFGGCCQAYR